MEQVPGGIELGVFDGSCRLDIGGRKVLEFATDNSVDPGDRRSLGLMSRHGVTKSDVGELRDVDPNRPAVVEQHGDFRRERADGCDSAEGSVVYTISVAAPRIECEEHAVEQVGIRFIHSVSLLVGDAYRAACLDGTSP